MAVFRKINVTFWEDSKVVDEFTPEDRYFMLYLMTNPHTNQTGCYAITLRQMEFETGYNKETVTKLISRFEKILKVIKYSESTKEILILNWHKYNWSTSPKIMACIIKEAKSIKNSEFRYCINRVLIEYGYSIDTQSQKEKEKEKEEEQEQEQEEPKPKTKKFITPSIEEVKEYCNERNNNIDAVQFHNYYTAKGWMIGKNKMKDWKAAIRTWEARDGTKKKATNVIEQPMTTKELLEQIREMKSTWT